MIERIQNCLVKKGERDLNNTILTIRLTGAEAARFWRIMDNAKHRNPYAGKSDVIRELLGLSELNVLTDEELALFRHKSFQPNDKTDAPEFIDIPDRGALTDERPINKKKVA